MLAQKNAYIENAYQQLKVISQDREKQLEYEAREKAIRDYNQMMHEAKTSGMEQGFQEGMEEGFKQGIEQGIEQGEARLLALAQRLSAAGRLDDLLRAADDSAYRDALFEEFEL